MPDPTNHTTNAVAAIAAAATLSWTAVNGKGQWGFMLRGQIRVWGKRYMEYRLGYGLYRLSLVKNKAMLYARIFKFRKYP